MLTIKPKTRKEIYLAYLSGDMSLELPEPLTRDEVNLYNLCKNKAYGEYTTVKEVLAECQPELVVQGGESGFVLEGVSFFVEGETYTVKWNGVDYKCTAVQEAAPTDVLTPVYIGNVDKLYGTGDTGEPFVAMANYDANMTAFMPFDGSTSLTVSVAHHEKSIKKISGKYVEGMGWSEKETVTVIPEQTITLKALSNTVAAENAFFVGDKVVVKWNGDIYECVAVALQGLVAVGNASLADMGEPSSEPFLIGIRGENAIIFAGEQGETSVRVDAITETIHPIDPKFLQIGTKLYHDSYSGKTYTDEQLSIELVFSDAVKVELPVTVALYSQGSFTGTEVSVVAKMVQDTKAYFYCVAPTDESGGFEMFSVTVMDKSGPM